MKLKLNSIIVGLLCFLAIFLLRYLSSEKQLLFLGLIMLLASGYKMWQFFKMQYSFQSLANIIALSLFIFSLINILDLVSFGFMNTVSIYILLSGSLFIFSQKRT